jgi:pimeloyl-ACP methyl ester carboxylesterase
VSEERIVEVLDGRFKIRVLEGGEGEPLLYLHGAAGLVWDPFLEALAGHYRVLAPEHPGSGSSSGLEYVHDLWDLVLYYDELLDVLDVPVTRVVGHSFGGMVAAELAANSPERVRTLVLIAPLGFWRDDHPIPELTTIPPDQMAELVLSDPDGPLAALLTSPPHDDPEALYRAALTIASINQFIWPLPDKGLGRRLYRVKAPTLVVWGRDDHLVHPEYADDFAAGLRDGHVELIDRAGHLPQLEQAGEVVPLVIDFLE